MLKKGKLPLFTDYLYNLFKTDAIQGPTSVFSICRCIPFKKLFLHFLLLPPFFIGQTPLAYRLFNFSYYDFLSLLLLFRVGGANFIANLFSPFSSHGHTISVAFSEWLRYRLCYFCQFLYQLIVDSVSFNTLRDLLRASTDVNFPFSLRHSPYNRPTMAFTSAIQIFRLYLVIIYGTIFHFDRGSFSV